MIVVNMFAAASAGKSTLAALVFGAVKIAGSGLVCEWVPEIAKEFVWEGRSHALSNRMHALGAQDLRVSRLTGQVDILVTDGPVLLNLAYARMEGGWPGAYDELCLWAHRRYPSLNVFVERIPGVPYEAQGRLQDSAGATRIDALIRDMLTSAAVPLVSAHATWEDAQRIARMAIGISVAEKASAASRCEI